jgi:hypothetical protein
VTITDTLAAEWMDEGGSIAESWRSTPEPRRTGSSSAGHDTRRTKAANPKKANAREPCSNSLPSLMSSPLATSEDVLGRLCGLAQGPELQDFAPITKNTLKVRLIVFAVTMRNQGKPQS